MRASFGDRVALSVAPHTPGRVWDFRLNLQVEVAAYYVVAEAFTNAAKHAQASELIVMANADEKILQSALPLTSNAIVFL
jgi:signal transduction histidine kinase